MIYLLIPLLFFTSCLNNSLTKSNVSEDYVLIEFASLLEQQYHKSHSPSTISDRDQYHQTYNDNGGASQL